MRKYTFLALSILACILVSASLVYAATPTPEEDKIEKIEEQLINNIASRVAELKLVQKRGVIGKVVDATNTKITLSDSRNETRFIDVDELTKFSNPNKSGSFGISDIAKDSTIGVLGLYNKESRRILARFITVTSVPTIIYGGVFEIDDDEYTLSITTKDKKQMTVDIENSTRTYSYTKDDGLVKSGFSKIKENSNIIIVGDMDKTDDSRISATRVIFFPEIPPDPKITSATQEEAESK